jgi:outer membrane protein
MSIKRTVISVVVFLGLFSATAMRAQASNASRVAVINMQAAILESVEGKKAAEILRAKYDAKVAELEKKKKEIEDLTAELKKQQQNLSEDAVAGKTKSIDTKQKELTRAGEDANNEFQQLQSEAINAVGNRILKIIQAFGAEQNFTLVIDNSSPQAGILYFNPTVDITTEIIRRFDAQSSGATTAKPAAPAPAQKK